MAEWPDERLDVLGELHLDPKNVRLETTSAQVEADIIEDLFANEDALGLVEGIAKIGYLTHEVPIVVRRRRKWIVVEGNRRVAALKAIQNPMIVPAYQARVTSLTRLIPDKAQLAQIVVKVAPNQAQADQLIAALHTSNPRRSWTPARQAAFFQAQIDAGRTYTQLLRRYPTVDVRRFVLRGSILDLFKRVSYTDPALHDFLQSRTWQQGLSALARLFESKDFQSITGLRLNEQGELEKSVSDDTFAEMATLIVRGMVEGNINTRSLNTVKSPRFLQLMMELRQIRDGTTTLTPDGGEGKDQREVTTHAPSSTTNTPNGEGGAQKASADGGTSAASGSSSTGSGRKPPPKPKVKWLDVGHLKVPERYPVAVRVHLGELTITDIQQLPNATFLMLRAILEKSIKSFAEAKGEDIKSSGHNSRGYVQLSHSLKWLLQYVKDNGPQGLIQPIEGVLGGTLVNYTATKDALDAVNHNHHFRVDPDEVMNMWNSIDPLMRHLMKP